jgi:hypothetical protein
MASKTCAGCNEPRPPYYFPGGGKLCEDCVPTFDGDEAGPADLAKVKAPRAPGTLVGIQRELEARDERAQRAERLHATRKPRNKKEAAQMAAEREAARAAALAKLLTPRRRQKRGGRGQ